VEEIYIQSRDITVIPMSGTEVLQTCKQALDLGLISQQDYDQVKENWKRAQSLKASFDAGLMDDTEYAQVKLDFLASVGLSLAKHCKGKEATEPKVAGSTTPNVSKPNTRAPVRTNQPEVPRRTSSQPDTKSEPAKDRVHASNGGRRSESRFHTGNNLPGKSMSGYSIDSGAVDAFNLMKTKSAVRQ